MHDNLTTAEEEVYVPMSKARGPETRFFAQFILELNCTSADAIAEDV